MRNESPVKYNPYGPRHDGPRSNRQERPLSPRQKDVLNSLRKGHSNKEISRDLGLAEGTVKVHLAVLFEKYQAKNRVDLVAKSLYHNPGGPDRDWLFINSGMATVPDPEG